jgi:CheY-like chemotaxis protein
MLVDDDYIALLLAEKRIRKDNFAEKVCNYQDPREAINDIDLNKDIAAGLPDIIFLDINMPLLDGWAFLNKIRDMKLAKMPFIFMLTSSDSVADRLRASTYIGIMHGFFTKNLDSNKLLATLEYINKATAQTVQS